MIHHDLGESREQRADLLSVMVYVVCMKVTELLPFESMESVEKDLS